MTYQRTVSQPLPPLHNIEYLRRMYFFTGFLSARTKTPPSLYLPLVDSASPDLNTSQKKALKLLFVAHDDTISYLNDTDTMVSVKKTREIFSVGGARLRVKQKYTIIPEMILYSFYTCRDLFLLNSPRHVSTSSPRLLAL